MKCCEGTTPVPLPYLCDLSAAELGTKLKNHKVSIGVITKQQLLYIRTLHMVLWMGMDDIAPVR